MFRTIRPTEIPASLTATSKKYNSPEVIEKLENMFHGKCYLCERDRISDINVEHLQPHKGQDDALKYDWNNLFLSCTRCNGIKSGKENIIDCTVYDVDNLIEIIPPHGDLSEIIVREGLNPSKIDISDTVKLVYDCYNDRSTGIKEISKINLSQSIIKHYTTFLSIRFKLLNNHEPLTQMEKMIEVDRLKIMCADNYPFSAFWKWLVYRDSQLKILIPLW